MHIRFVQREFLCRFQGCNASGECVGAVHVDVGVVNGQYIWHVCDGVERYLDREIGLDAETLLEKRPNLCQHFRDVLDVLGAYVVFVETVENQALHIAGVHPCTVMVVRVRVTLHVKTSYACNEAFEHLCQMQ